MEATEHLDAQGPAERVSEMADPMVGMLLPRHYRIQEKIGRGAMSVVYKGVYEPLEQPVAIKLLKSHLVSEVPTLKRFQQEAKTAGALDHRNIVTVFDFGVTDQGVPYLVMELIQGLSLHQLLRGGSRLPLDQALQIFIQTAEALEYTHERGVIHRDVKPSNILVPVDNDGKMIVKLADFGIAKIQSYEGDDSASLTATGEVFGTPLYVSPEQALGKKIDWHSDIYSLGCVMYETIAGRPPFQAATAFDVLRLQIQSDPNPIEDTRAPGELPLSLVSAIQRAMHKSPEHRQQSMTELIAELRIAMSELESPQTEEPQLPAVRTPSHRLKAVSQNKLQPVSQSRLPAISASTPPSASNQTRSPLLPFLALSTAGCLLAGGFWFGMHQRQKNDAGKSATHGVAATEAEYAATREKALARYDAGDFAAAQTLFADAIASAKQSGLQQGAALLLAEQCMTQVQLKNYDAAFASGTESVAIMDRLKDVPRKDLALALRALGVASFYRNDFGTSERLLRRSTALDKEVYGTADERYAIGVGRLAKVFENEKKFKEAEQAYREALAVSRACHQPGDGHLAMRTRALADFLRSRKKFSEAQALERKARALDKEH